MIQIIDDRSTGKTMRLMLIAKEKGATIVCDNPSALLVKAYGYGITGVNFITFQEYLENPTDYPKIVIDELPLLFKKYLSSFNSELIAFSASKD